MATPTSFQQLQSDVDSLAGLDLTDEERDRFINEGNLELCVRSGWTRDNLEFGPSVTGQQLYSLPSTFRQPADDRVVVGNQDFMASSAETVRKIARGDAFLTEAGLWYMDYEDGERKLGIYPARSDGVSITMLCVVTPDQLLDPDDTPPVPWDFRGAIIQYVRARALGYSEDDPEGQDIGYAEFERQVDRLTRLRIETENGDGPIQVMARGVHY